MVFVSGEFTLFVVTMNDFEYNSVEKNATLHMVYYMCVVCIVCWTKMYNNTIIIINVRD